MVNMFTLVGVDMVTMAASVVLLPEPVAPVTSTMPVGYL